MNTCENAKNRACDELSVALQNANISYPSVHHANAKVIRHNGIQAVYSACGEVVTVINLKMILED